MFINKPSETEIYANDFAEVKIIPITEVENPSLTIRKSIVQKKFEELQTLVEKEEFNFIPVQVYEKLPPLLKEASNIFLEAREKDIFLSGALAVLGGCFHNVYAYNIVDGKFMNPNIFMFIVAPPGSGKQSMMYARYLSTQITKAYKKIGKVFDLPGNISTAALLKILQANEGSGILVESEIDTIVNTKKQDWGDYSDIIRVAFENDSYRYARVNSLVNEIEELKFSISLSGTPNQFRTLIPSIENGLFSRGCYYFFNDEYYEYKPYGRFQTKSSLTETFDDLANQVKLKYESISNLQYVKVNFIKEQLELIKLIFEVEEKEIEDLDLRANINRVFAITLKIATTLTILNTDNYSNEISCDDDMLSIAILLTMTYLKHCYKAFNLIKHSKAIKLSKNEQRILSKLPNKFTRSEAIEHCKDLNLAEKTIDNRLKSLKDKRALNSPAHGIYMKDNEEESFL